MAGVKGMKWGQHKSGASSSAKKMPKRYEGLSDKQIKRAKTADKVALVGITGLVAGNAIRAYGPSVVRGLASAQNAKRAAAGAAAANAALRGIGANPTAALKLVGGVWKLAA